MDLIDATILNDTEQVRLLLAKGIVPYACQDKANVTPHFTQTAKDLWILLNCIDINKWCNC